MCDYPECPVRLNEMTASLPLFEVGTVVATVGALDLLDRSGVNATDLLAKHVAGDWGVVSLTEAELNRRALENRSRVVSVYDLGHCRERLLVITASDRTRTTLLLPEEL